jgi:hypothetical protein
VTLRHTEDIDVIVDGEDRRDRHLLLEERLSEVDLRGDITTVHLDLDEVRLLLAELHETDLGVREHANHVCVLLETSQLGVDVLRRKMSTTGARVW